jgi:hypothetical protein
MRRRACLIYSAPLFGAGRPPSSSTPGIDAKTFLEIKTFLEME